jgi:glyoxylate reductase
MKPTAWVVNTSRGPVIDQVALSDALKTKQIAGAVLDVLEVEPPAADDPILSLENAFILPHIGSATVETRAAMLELAANNFIAVMAGQTPPECVNPEVLERALQRR